MLYEAVSPHTNDVYGIGHKGTHENYNVAN